ncbi:GTPase-activating protein, putative [Babesia caballi]|uniref:GTPase-activating protein, putative n=1 Tax=Babesia caballi TaxID=5871 RepID=A0AAV4M0L2_BABCB|nr:GTPase-activating protein, putative [Babesia caballi]
MEQDVLGGEHTSSSSKSDFISELLSIGEPQSALREEKWISMKNRGLAFFAKSHWNTFVRRTNRGIPQKFRWESWKVALKFERYAAMLASNYETVSSQPNEYASIIQIDVPRYASPSLAALHGRPERFPNSKSSMLTRSSSFRAFCPQVAYANYHPEVGYCQGMNFVAGMLLLVSGFNEVETYIGFVGLMKEFGLAEFYLPSFPLIQKYIQGECACEVLCSPVAAFEALTEDMWPDLHRHFQSEEISVAVFLHQWFLTMFVVILPLRTVVALWDYMLYNGLSSVLAVALGLLYLLAPQMKQLKFEGIMGFLKHIKDADSKDDIRVGRIIVNQAYRITLSRGCLDTFILAQQAISTANLPSFTQVVTRSGGESPSSSGISRNHPNPLAAIVSKLGLKKSPHNNPKT